MIKRPFVPGLFLFSIATSLCADDLDVSGTGCAGALSACGGVLAFALGVAATTLFFLRKKRAEDGILARLPLRFFVFDREGRILRGNLGDQPDFAQPGKKLRTLGDLPVAEVNAIIAGLIPEVLADGVQRNVTFDYGGTKRSAIMAKLPFRLFRCEAVVWISQDTADIQLEREKFRALAEHFQLTLNSIGEAVLSTDREGRVVLLNPIAEELTGWNAREAVGTPCEEVFRTATESAPREASAAESHAELIARDGRRRRITSNTAPICDEKGAAAGSIVVFRDATAEYLHQEELKGVLARAESINTELQDLLAQHQLLLDIMPIYVYGEDANDSFRHVFCNHICSELWGRPIEEVMGKSDVELFGDSEEVRRFQETDAAVVASGELHESIQPFTGSDGKRHIGRFFRKGIDLSGGRRWMFGLVVDVTEEYNQRAQLDAVVNIFEYAFDLTRSAVFRLDPETFEMTGAKLLGELWPIRDGKAISLEELVFPEDQESVALLQRQLVAGECESATIDFRTVYFGEMRYYRVKAGVDRESYGKLTLIGVIQDVTEITKNIWKLQETTALQDIIVNAIPTIFFVKNANDDFRYVLTNRALEDFAGYSREEILGKTDFELQHPGSEAVRRADLNVMNHPEGISAEEKRYDSQGIPHTFQMLKKPFIGLHGERLLLGVASDITELSELNASQKTLNVCLSNILLQGEERLGIEQILSEIGARLNASICYLMRYDLEQKQMFAGGEWRANDQIPPVSILDPVPFADDDAWIRAIAGGDLLAAPDVEDPEAIVRFGLRPEMNRHFGVKSLYAIRIMVDGKLWGSCGVAFCAQHLLNQYETAFIHSAGSLIGVLQQRRKDQESLRAALQQAQSADRAKSYFLASMSHEIRTPLNAVIGFAELLTDTTLPPEEQKEYLRSISSAGNTLLALINDVLDLSKLEAGQMVFTTAETDFSELLREVGSIFRQKCTEKKLNLLIRSEGIPPVWLDKLRMRQILFNLIGNAVKFTDTGSIRITASFARDTREKGTLTFCVADTGIGIPQEDQARLFQMFVQSRSLRGGQGGTGLGLAIVQRMLERMNGGIVLESTLGKGSEFTVTLRGIEYGDFAAGAEKGHNAEALGEGVLHGTALLVDDIPINLKVMGAMLQKIGIKTTMAAGGEEALKLLEENTFDFLLTDLWMPGMNGAELGTHLRRDPRFNAMHMAVVTADTENGEGFDISIFDAVIPKPVTLEKLRTFLRSAAE